MLRSRNYLCLLLFAPVSLIGPTVGCTGKIDSPLLNRPLVIDGDDADWGEARLFLKEIQGSLGLFNDTDYLYLSLGVTEPNLQRQIIARGFTVWLDSEGGKNKTFGIRFPLGIRGREFNLETRGAWGAWRDRGADADQLQTMFERSVERSEVELIGPNPHQKRRLSLESGGPVQLAVTFTDLRLVYEAKVPFSEINALSGAKPDFAKHLGLGLETGKFDFGAMRGQMPGRRGGRGTDGGLGGGMSGGGPFAGGDRRKGSKAGMAPGSRLEALELWTKVRLAAP